MLAASIFGAFFGAGSTLAFFEYSGTSNLGIAKQLRGAGGGSRGGAVTPTVPMQNAPVKVETIDQSAMAGYHQMNRYGLPSTDTVFVKQGYISSFDPMLRIPRWVMEIITPATVEAKSGSRSHSKFYSNPTIPEHVRSTDKDYTVSKMSRGHLAPAQFHKDSQLAMDSTFDLSLNVVPQDMASNATDWMRVEQLCKKLTKDYERLYVVTGPLFIPRDVPGPKPKSDKRRVVQYEVVGSHQVAVPTHLFKSILAEAKDGSLGMATFVVPNEPLADERPLTSFLVPRSAVEQWTGLALFPKVRGTTPTTMATGAPEQGLVQVPGSAFDLCMKTKCEASAGGFGTAYRQVAKLRVASTPLQLEAAWREVTAGGKSSDALVLKEYNAQREAFGMPPATAAAA